MFDNLYIPRVRYQDNPNNLLSNMQYYIDYLKRHTDISIINKLDMLQVSYREVTGDNTFDWHSLE